MKKPKSNTKSPETTAVKPAETLQTSQECVSKMPDVPLPDANTLSILAAQARFNAIHQHEAVRNALALWSEAQSLIEREKEFATLRYEGYTAPLQKIKRPKHWPGSFTDFLRLVVQGKDEGEQLHRFRRYLLKNIRSKNAFRAGTTALEGPQSKEELDEINEQILLLKAGKVPQFWWEHNALEFGRWWDAEKVEAKRRAGNARVTRARDKKKTAKVV